MTGKEISEYITFPKTFEKYRWYKPILGNNIFNTQPTINCRFLCNMWRKHYGPTPAWRI